MSSAADTVINTDETDKEWKRMMEKQFWKRALRIVIRVNRTRGRKDYVFEGKFDMTQHQVNPDYYAFFPMDEERKTQEFRPELGDSIQFTFMQETWDTKKNMIQKNAMEWSSSSDEDGGNGPVWFVMEEGDHTKLEGIHVAKGWLNDTFRVVLYGNRMEEIRDYYLGQVVAIQSNLRAFHKQIRERQRNLLTPEGKQEIRRTQIHLRSLEEKKRSMQKEADAMTRLLENAKE
jgi:hypothetical protein